MKYAIIIMESDETISHRSDPEKAGAYWAGYDAYCAALAEAGVMAPGGMPLQPRTTATTLRIRDGKHQVLDGPYADTKEQLGGVMVIDVPNLDAALEWAARCPAASVGAVEVRPIYEMPAKS